MFLDDLKGLIDVAVEVTEHRSIFGGFRYASEVSSAGIKALADNRERSQGAYMGQAKEGNLPIFHQAAGDFVSVVVGARGHTDARRAIALDREGSRVGGATGCIRRRGGRAEERLALGHVKGYTIPGQCRANEGGIASGTLLRER